MALLAIKVSSTWFAGPTPPLALTVMPNAFGAGSTKLLLAMVVCCNVSPEARANWIPNIGPETLPVIVLPVISIWSQVFSVGGAPAAWAQAGQKTIPIFWTFVITRLPMVMLEKVVPVATGNPNFAAGGSMSTQFPQFRRASP